jgi:hypothetical protein
MFPFVVLPSSIYLFTVYGQGVFFSLDYTQAHTTFGRTPLDGGLARRRDLCLTRKTLYKTNIHPPGWIRTRNPRKSSAADQRFRLCGHRE